MTPFPGGEVKRSFLKGGAKTGDWRRASFTEPGFKADFLAGVLEGSPILPCNLFSGRDALAKQASLVDSVVEDLSKDVDQIKMLLWIVIEKPPRTRTRPTRKGAGRT